MDATTKINRTFTATLPNGEVVTRNSKSFVFTHVVAMKATAAHAAAGGVDGWFAASWASSFDKAQRITSSLHESRIIEVDA